MCVAGKVRQRVDASLPLSQQRTTASQSMDTTCAFHHCTTAAHLHIGTRGCLCVPRAQTPSIRSATSHIRGRQRQAQFQDRCKGHRQGQWCEWIASHRIARARSVLQQVSETQAQRRRGRQPPCSLVNRLRPTSSRHQSFGPQWQNAAPQTAHSARAGACAPPALPG